MTNKWSVISPLPLYSLSDCCCVCLACLCSSTLVSELFTGRVSCALDQRNVQHCPNDGWFHFVLFRESVHFRQADNSNFCNPACYKSFFLMSSYCLDYVFELFYWLWLKYFILKCYMSIHFCLKLCNIFSWWLGKCIDFLNWTNIDDLCVLFVRHTVVSLGGH